VACVRCGATPPAGARFCPGCGLELTGAARREERKLVSILFVDQVGSTSRADGADPEDVRDRNRLYYEETRGRIERHGGLLEKYAGDAVMAVFGVPLARANDAESAVRAALSILEGIRQLNGAHPGLDLDVRVGICTGEAVVEIDAPAESALATGDCVNVAARLQSAAPPGRAIVGAETYRLTKHAFGYEELPAFAAKGKRHPVAAWLVEQPLALSVSSSELRSTLVGRNHEMVLLRTVWERAVEGRQPHLVSVIGEAGIGKSRLTAEIGAEVESGGALVLWARSHPYDQPTPYRAVAQLVRQAAAIFESDAVEVARQKLGLLLASLAPPDEVEPMTRYLSLLLSLGLDERARETIDLQYATRRLLENLSERAPLMIVLDDIQWADEASLDLVGYLSKHFQDHRIVIVALARPELVEARPGWGAGLPAFTSLVLSPLSPEEASEAASVLLSRAEPLLVARVVATAEGNPLFIEELVASVEDEETSEKLPSTIRAVIAARIDGLPADARAALLNASVIGKIFWRGVLARIGDVEELGAALDALETRGLIQRRSASRVQDDVEFSFKHDLILDTAYATLPRATRRQLHAATATALESLVLNPAEIAWILAHHWREGGDAERAGAYLLVAAERAADALAVEETYDFYTQALDLAEDPSEQYRIRLLRGLALVQLEDFARAADELAELVPNLEGSNKVEALLGRTHATLWTEQADATMASAREALRLARAGGFPELEPVAVGLLGAAHGMRGDEGDVALAVELGEQALESWVPNTRKAELAEHCHLMSDHYYWLGDYERAMNVAQLSATTAGVDLRSREFRLRGAGMRAIGLAGVGRYEEAIAAAQDAIELATAMGRPMNVVLNYSTLPLRETFSLDEALERSDAVADRLGPSDFNMPWINARADAFTARVMRGDVPLAQREWGSLWEDALASKAWERWLISGRLAAVRADLELSIGHIEDALTWGSRAIEMAVASSRRKYEAIARTTVGRTLIRQRLYQDAASELRRAVALADSLGSPLLRWQSRAPLAQALAETGGEADAVRDEAVQIIRAVAAGLSSQRAATYLTAPQVAEVLEATG
jgi:class 3 adenylate cyclase/tetratricopeptide (TPR) repeat protein